MSRKRRVVEDPRSIEHVNKAVAHLRAARDFLALAGASRSAARVRASLKSAEGARRHVEGCYSRSLWAKADAAHAVGSQ